MPITTHNDTQACSQKIKKISRLQSSLCCPQDDEILWDAHPKIYLYINNNTDSAICCPYCGTTYIRE